MSTRTSELPQISTVPDTESEGFDASNADSLRIGAVEPNDPGSYAGYESPGELIDQEGRRYNPELVIWGVNQDGEARPVITTAKLAEFGRQHGFRGADGLAQRVLRGYLAIDTLEQCYASGQPPSLPSISAASALIYLLHMKYPDRMPAQVGEHSRRLYVAACNELFLEPEHNGDQSAVR